MDFRKMYEEKLVTAEEAAKAVKSGDWVDYGWTTELPWPSTLPSQSACRSLRM